MSIIYISVITNSKIQASEFEAGPPGATGPETGFSSRYPKPGFLDTIPASLYQMIYM
jgi:hypothetical protein